MGTAPQAPSTVTVSAEIVKATQSNIDSLRERANAIQVKTPQEYVQVCNLVIEGRGFIKRWQEVFAGDPLGEGTSRHDSERAQRPRHRG